jgi:rubredoxin
MTLGTAAAAAQVRLIVWCKAYQHQVEPDPAQMGAHMADTRFSIGRERMVCSECGSRKADFVVTRTERR